jgi:hypothetical protein
MAAILLQQFDGSFSQKKVLKLNKIVDSLQRGQPGCSLWSQPAHQDPHGEGNAQPKLWKTFLIQCGGHSSATI